MRTDASAPLTASLVLKLEARDDLSDEERVIIEQMFTEARLIKASDDIVRDGDRPRHSTLVVSGVAARYKVLQEGERQITALHLAGDFVDLHSFLLKEMDHGVTAISQCRIATVPHETLAALSVSQPHLTRLFWLLTLLDGALHREWLVAMGRRSAVGQLAHLLCELKMRLGVVGTGDRDSFTMPVTQVDLSDILGLSSVHVNRVLQELRAENLIAWKGVNVSIHDWDGLRRLAEFDDRYLHIVKEPR
jgi:CRP-like cAMP-binding protein